MSLRLVTASSILIAFAAAAVASAPANAGEAGLVEFRFHADELEAPRGPDRVFRKLDRAARGACVTSGRKTLRDAAVERECHASLVAEFIDKIDDSRLSALHAEASGAASGR
ncbi:MAG: UrcA family protein [Parvularculaceae bacterium]